MMPGGMAARRPAGRWAKRRNSNRAMLVAMLASYSFFLFVVDFALRFLILIFYFDFKRFLILIFPR